ncbi:hypothetical protein IPZ68_15130, partial [Streptomyces arenae]|nr:hypothetical protein [Streptomyces arenae]
MPIRCPDCRREHLYAPPHSPCACGAPVAPTVVRGAAPVPVTDATWADQWVTVRCWACGRQGQWPQPELGCSCGTTLRIPVVARETAAGEPAGGDARGRGPRAGDPSAHGRGAGEPEADGTGEDRPQAPPAHIPLPRTA